MKKCPMIIAAGISLFFLSVSGPTQAQDLEKVQVETIPVAGNIYMLIGEGGNIAVSVGEDGILLVDNQFPELVEKIKAAVAKLHPGPIRFVLNTNWHYDHADGNELLAEAGAIVIAHENSRKHMLSEWSAPEIGPDFKIPPYPKKALPVITVSDSLTLHFNGDEIRMLYIPNAHSDGDLLFHFAKANVIHTGDLFFSNGFPFINISSGGTAEGMIKASDIILGICNEQTKVIPGHGPLSGADGVRAFKDLVVSGRDRIATLFKQGKSLDEVLSSKPVEGLLEGGESWLSPDIFVKMVYLDLTGEFRKR